MKPFSPARIVGGSATASYRARDGRNVRGGRWRNDPARPPSPDNRSFETGPAADLGFRCIRDLDETAVRDEWR